MYLSKDENGKIKFLDMTKPTLLARGGRVTGLGKIMEQQVLPYLEGEKPAAWGQTLREGAVDVARSAAAPFVGPPLNMASTLATGKTPLGYEQRAPGENRAPYIGAAIGAANPLAGPMSGFGYEGSKHVYGDKPSEIAKQVGTRAGEKLGSLVGIKEQPTPRQIIENLRRQYLYKQGEADKAAYAPSEYKPLITELSAGNIDNAKKLYAELIKKKMEDHKLKDDPELEAQRDLNTYFTKFEREHAGLTSKEKEEDFRSKLSPHNQQVYQRMLDEQSKLAEKFFDEIQPKMSGKKKFKLGHF
jgi:hypothetical protein